jgi:hypothetical protein
MIDQRVSVVASARVQRLAAHFRMARRGADLDAHLARSQLIKERET